MNAKRLVLDLREVEYACYDLGVLSVVTNLVAGHNVLEIVP